MSRSYKGVIAKKHRVYSVDGLKALYDVTANTVSNWVGSGLLPSDCQRPYVFRGAVVTRFHKVRREQFANNLRPGEFKCFSCKAVCFPDINTVADRVALNGKRMLDAQCSDCGAPVSKTLTATDLDAIEDCKNPNTPRRYLHEGHDKGGSHIGIGPQESPEDEYLTNDRLVSQWQLYAGRYDPKTQDTILASFRFFETVTKGKAFSDLTIEDMSAVREKLKSLATEAGPEKLSRSTISHKAANLSKFFEWVLNQPSCAHLPRDLPDYLKLPKSVLSSALPTKEKQFPTLSQAEDMLSAMPKGALVQRRDSAIFALAFLGALRADTLISLRVKDVDVAAKQITQDANGVRTKNGKSLKIGWFPIGELFETAVIDWLELLDRQGFVGDDALFPSKVALENPRKLRGEGRAIVRPMETTHAVTVAFATASRLFEVAYTPHAAKHTIAYERDIRPLTRTQSKAWSENMGHESEATTQVHYGHLSTEQRLEVIESIGVDVGFSPIEISDNEKIAFFDEIMKKVTASENPKTC